MSRKRKAPATAGTKARAKGTAENKQTNSSRTVAPCQCPRCGFLAPAPLFTPGWVADLQVLADRYSHFGFGPDLASLSPPEFHGLWAWLSRQGS